MGWAKDRMMQEQEQGWSFSENQICSRCISDPYLKPVINNSATNESPCSFCGRRPSVELDEVLEIIGNTVADYYNRAVNEAPYESAEGGYQGVTFDTFEVMEHIVGGISRRDAVIQAISASFDDDIWVERNMFSLNGVQKYVASGNSSATPSSTRRNTDPAGSRRMRTTTRFLFLQCSMRCTTSSRNRR